ncbi:MAG: glucose-6-phosphate dehydrogenase [Hydrogenophaga sp.]|jgi:glucose-6-phosphate 1-dehydrogenase|uniref:glucose-6-phosphate dehydrogenase n=2 Tax=Hydrogenophaga sp. TaxID=1904254 RepID=UPI0027278CCA|nr:glucose-6-phosphate dehydrogenase [Hydrogenophaga sp.]MDO9570745.1 glucose-6-phosphate dehydrogenase [Hydrogenophaga sp.]MDP1892880.1 glucose-6-phosphate dehydrogenase [Hydrogenophaga sp.]MDP3808710.1 glucose-6-phosphate dehydrogenase [Hydrogenophaga sp.]MDP3924903.1 glucose-6-phosphate dehydrogenase [Hydrogenophaga sp.]MDZ4237452.1 glucose-6-phosphate dehydrogenase [Hydrogenophaga sp.]
MSTSTSRPTPAAPLDLVIFGGVGDLSVRKLLPALYMAHLHNNLPAATRIHALGRQVWERNEFVAFVQEKVRGFIEDKAFIDAAWVSFLERLNYVSVDATQAPDFHTLAAALQGGSDRVYYLATAPSLFVGICANLHSAGLIDERARVVLEKPLGHDLASARQINDDVGRYFQEQQIFRIDHYLGKETVQNLMVLRFGNTIFEPLWRSPYIKSVQITVAESVGVGSRAGFYDGTGAMRDMVQNHLLQLLCIVAMEPPVSLDPDAVRDEKLKVLRSLRPMTMADVARDTVRGQYSAGASNGDAALGYLQEDNIPDGSTTETFVALKAHINNWRWANVPIFLRTGKRMAARQSEIVIEFADLPFTIFQDSPHQSVNRLMIRLQPEEHIQLQMMAKEPGSGMKLRPVNLNLDLETAFSERRAEAYERLLIDVIKGRLTHFMRRDELEAAWTWVEPIINGWQQLNDKPKAYTAGSWGPAASSALMAREGSSWVEES